MNTKVIPILAFLLSFTLGVSAQQAGDGRKVKRITFDREQVNIEYADGTKDQQVSAATVKRENATTGIVAVKSKESRQTTRQWYTLDGRLLQGEPQQKGVYIVRDKNGKRKAIKK